MATTLMSLVATLSLDKQGFDTGVKESQSTFSKLGGSAKKLMSVTAKAATAAVGAASVAIGKIIKDAAAAYANYEQLVGGVETLFGAGGQSLSDYADSVGKSISAARREYNILIGSQNEVLQNSREAFKTAGMSANEYMETVTSFSASLIQSLDGDTARAAKVADQAIIDMSDNANKMGTDIESIKTAYAGFAKQNYTMLDNLKLGYGGTKTEMERLIKDANRLRKAQGKSASLTIESYADVIEAIHTVQDEIGITGTTAEEAEKTIQGSLSATKAAWQNVLVAVAGGNINLKSSINSLVDSAITSFRNIMPVIMNALDGIGEVIQQVAPIVAENLPALVRDILPKLLDAAIQLVGGLVSALPGILSAVELAVHSVLETIIEYLNDVGLGNLGSFVIGVQNVLGGIVNLLHGDIRGAFDSFAVAVGNIIQGVLETFGMDSEQAEGIMNGVVTWIQDAFDSISGFWTETLKPVFDAIYTFMTESIAPTVQTVWTDTFQPAITGAFEAVANFWNDNMVPVFEAIREWLEEKLGPAFDVVTGAINGDKESMDKLIEAFNTLLPIVAGAIGAFIGYRTALVINKVIDIVTHSTDLLAAAQAALNAVMNANPLVLIITLLSGLVAALVTAYNTNDEFRAKVDEAWSKIKETAEVVWGAVTEWFSNLGQTFKDVWTKYLKPVVAWFDKTFSPAISAIKDTLSGVISFITDVFTGNWSGAWDTIVNGFGEIFSGIEDLIKAPINAVIDGINWMIDAVESAVNGIINGINNHVRIKLKPIDVWPIGRIFNGVDWSPNLQTVEWGNIQRLATGGYLNEGQSAIVGEYRPERLSVVNGHAFVQPIGGIQPGDRFGGNNTYNNTINIYQQPGEDIDVLTERIETVLTRVQKQREAAFA